MRQQLNKTTMTSPSGYLAAYKEKISQQWKTRKRFALNDLPDWLIALMLAACSLGSLRLLSILNDIGPDFIQIYHDTGYIDRYAVAGAVIMGLMGIKAWFLGMIAGQCNGILKKRWFEPRL